MATAAGGKAGAGLASTDAITVEMTELGTQSAAESTEVSDWGSSAVPAAETGAEVATAAGAKSTATGAIINFVNSIIGAGIIGLPFALQEAGLIGGLLLIFIVGLATGECQAQPNWPGWYFTHRPAIHRLQRSRSG